MRPLYIVGTHQHAGKTTLSVGLVCALRGRGLSVGYVKPLGQRVSVVDGEAVHDDALVISQAMGLEHGDSESLIMPLTQGRVEKEIYDLHARESAQRVVEVCEKLRAEHDLVIVEGMGHVAAGSCLQLSAADVARYIDAACVVVGGGGIGRAIDDISLCATFMTSHGARLLGAVVNKVWPEKYARVKEATTRGLATLGIQSLGTVPYDRLLASPTFEQVAEEFGGEILSGRGSLTNRVGNTIVAAMEADHMVNYLKEQTLVITPGDRSDNILAVLSVHMLSKLTKPAVAGIVLTGGFRPAGNVIALMVQSGLPVMLCKEDTYTLAAKMGELIFKLKPGDKERIELAVAVMKEYVDIDGILKGLGA